MNLIAQRTIPAPQAAVWDALNDNAMLQACIPGSREGVRPAMTGSFVKVARREAAAFWAKSLYLPVPTISREVKVRPATVQVSLGQVSGVSVKDLASAYKVDDLQHIAIGKLDIGKN